MFRLLTIAALLASGCAATGESGRSRLVAPQDVGGMYSEVELQAQLALTADSACAGAACEEAAAFRRQVARLGGRLSHAAFLEYPALRKRIPNFYFSVSPKEEVGTLSSGFGTVAVMDGLRALAPEEPALAFVLAREMGHVIAEHHEENSATSLLVSVAVTLALPVANLIRGAALAAQQTLSASAATTAASFAGSRALKSLYRPEQTREADVIALRLMLRAGYRLDEAAAALAALAPRLKDDGWMGELLASKGYLDAVTAGPPLPAPEVQVAAAPTPAAPAPLVKVSCPQSEPRC